MATVLETIPEFENDAATAAAHLPNFTFDQMRSMLLTSTSNQAHRILAVIDSQDAVAGYSIFSIKTDEAGDRYGYLFSRGVAPQHRRRGIATQLLAVAHEWFIQQKARYARAETHIGNIGLQALLERHGYQSRGPYSGLWPYLVMEKILETPIP